MNKKDEIPLKTKIHDELGNQEFLICKENEVLIKNSHIDIEIESINEILRNKSYKDQNHDNRKTKNKNKLSEVVKNEVFETDGVVEDSKNEFEKRKSYRAKAKDFSQQKVKKSAKSSTKIQFENQSMDIIKKQKKVEKRQGWWSQ